MDRSLWPRLDRLLDEALDLPPERRRDLVARRSCDDPALLRAAEDLLAAHEAAGDFMEEPLTLIPREPLLALVGAVEGRMSDVPRPDSVGPFQVTGVLGRGGMGTVYEGWDDTLGCPVALKVLAETDVAESRFERLRREARVLARLDHPCLVRVLDVLDVDGAPVLVMEKVEGWSLTTLIDAEVLDLRIALGIARQVASGLEAAHAAGVIHRDLKAHNIMVDGDGATKILDFGIAKIDRQVATESDEDSPSSPGHIVGTVDTLAPEQVAGEAASARSDLFALGCLLHHMLTGEHPFADGTLIGTMRRIATVEPPLVHTVKPEVPVAVSGLVDSLLAKDPWRRPRSAREVAKVLGRVIEEVGRGGGKAG